MVAHGLPVPSCVNVNDMGALRVSGGHGSNWLRVSAVFVMAVADA